MQRRIERLLQICLDVSLGTVWRVREDLWRETFRAQGQRYDEHGTRCWHPGLSLREQPVSSLHEYVPMLFGATGEHGPVVVRGLSRERGPAHATSFGRILRPAHLSVRAMTSPPSDAPADRLTGPWFDRSRVSRNAHKPKLDQNELENLRAWAQRRGLI
jgi:hypothetical protein